MMRRTYPGLAGLMILTTAGALAAEPVELTALLERSVIGPQLSLIEVQRFCAEQTPRMPRISTLTAWRAEADRLRAAVLD